MISVPHVVSVTARLASFERRDPAAIRAWQLGKMIALVRHAFERVPMYRRYYSDMGFEPGMLREYGDLGRIPVLTKAIIRSFPVEKRVAQPLPTDPVHRESTSGSTGEPVEVWSTETEAVVQALKGIRCMMRWGYRPTHRVVQLWREDPGAKTSLLQSVGLFRRAFVSILSPVDEAIARMVALRPHVLFAVRSSLEVYGEEMARRGIRISPRFLIAGSEVLTPEMSQRLRAWFGCGTLELYGCVETGNVAWGCPVHPLNLHLEEETTVVVRQAVSARGGDAARGAICITNLENRVMPFIQFDPGDVVEAPAAEYCPCGSSLRLLGRAWGRNDDVVVAGGRKLNFHIFYQFFKDFSFIRRYRVRQRGEGPVEFQVELVDDTPEWRERCRGEILSGLGRWVGDAPVHFVGRFPVQPNGKFKVIERLP